MVKGQMKIQQMAFMLMAVALFFVLAGMFVVVYRFSGLRESAVGLEEKNALLLVTKIANSPEFSCGEAFDGARIACIDTDKVMMLKQDSYKYDGFWGSGISNIELIRIYPAEEQKLCSIANYPNCNTIKIVSEEEIGIPISNFVSLCRKESIQGNIYNKCELGKIFVSYEGVE